MIAQLTTALSRTRAAACGRVAERLLGQFPSRLATIGIAIKTNNGTIRIEQSPAYRVTSNKSRSRGRTARPDQRRTPNTPSTTPSKGQYGPLWNVREAD